MNDDEFVRWMSTNVVYVDSNYMPAMKTPVYKGSQQEEFIYCEYCNQLTRNEELREACVKCGAPRK